MFKRLIGFLKAKRLEKQRKRLEKSMKWFDENEKYLRY